jgi:hypothetical protein
MRICNGLRSQSSVSHNRYLERDSRPVSSLPERRVPSAMERIHRCPAGTKWARLGNVTQVLKERNAHCSCRDLALTRVMTHAQGCPRRRVSDERRPFGFSSCSIRSSGFSHGACSVEDSCCRSCSGVNLRNSQKLNSGNFTPRSPYGVRSLQWPIGDRTRAESAGTRA